MPMIETVVSDLWRSFFVTTLEALHGAMRQLASLVFPSDCKNRASSREDHEIGKADGAFDPIKKPKHCEREEADLDRISDSRVNTEIEDGSVARRAAATLPVF